MHCDYWVYVCRRNLFEEGERVLSVAVLLFFCGRRRGQSKAAVPVTRLY